MLEEMVYGQSNNHDNMSLISHEHPHVELI